MKIINFSETTSLITEYLAQLRDINVQKDRLRFRENIKRLSFCMAYEISKELSYEENTVATPLGDANAKTLKQPPVIAFVLRAGLAMHQGFLDAFDGADHCFISAYREEGNIDTIKIHVEYLASPDLTGRTVILVDPMLATGGSMVGGVEALLKKGKPEKLHIACIVAAPEGIEKVKNEIPLANKLWLAAIDDKLDENAYIVPGLGDAGDLAFGVKTF